jgi:hypothetical protein
MIVSIFSSLSEHCVLRPKFDVNLHVLKLPLVWSIVCTQKVFYTVLMVQWMHYVSGRIINSCAAEGKIRMEQRLIVIICIYQIGLYFVWRNGMWLRLVITHMHSNARAHTHTHTHTYIYVCVSVCVCVCMWVCVYVCVCVCEYVCVYVCVWVCVYIYICVCVCVYICVCVSVCVCMYVYNLILRSFIVDYFFYFLI